MTSVAKIKKHAKTNLIPFLEDRGFTYESKTFQFYKKEKGIYQLVIPQLSRGNHAYVEICCWVPEIAPDPEAALEVFPKSIAYTNGGRLDTMGITLSGMFWPIGNDEEIASFLDNAVELIDRHVLPWFDSIDDRNKLIESMHADVKDAEWFDEMKEAILTVE